MVRCCGDLKTNATFTQNVHCPTFLIISVKRGCTKINSKLGTASYQIIHALGFVFSQNVVMALLKGLVDFETLANPKFEAWILSRIFDEIRAP